MASEHLKATNDNILERKIILPLLSFLGSQTRNHTFACGLVAKVNKLDLKEQTWYEGVVKTMRYPSFFSVPVGTAVKIRQHLSQPLTSAKDAAFQFTQHVDFPMERMQASGGVTIARMVGPLLHFND